MLSKFKLLAAIGFALLLSQIWRQAEGQVHNGLSSRPHVRMSNSKNFGLVVDCQIKGKCSSGVLFGQPFLGTYAYAYAPAIVFDAAGTTHYFFCSSGDGIGVDAIRYVSVKAGTGPLATDTPTVVVRAAPTKTATGATIDEAACDPAVVRYKGPSDSRLYYYLYYTSVVVRPGYKSCGEASRDGMKPCKDVIQVARSERINGPYLVLKKNGVWGAPGVVTKIILESFGSNWGLGVAQQSVMIVNGKLVMFYSDDTDAPRNPARPWYMIESNNPVNWDKAKARKLQLPIPVDPYDKYLNSGDFKYDPLRHQFVLVSTAPSLGRAPKKTFLQISSSADGIRWNPWKIAIPPPRFPNYAHNPGTLSDDRGWIVRRAGEFSFAFAANPNLSSYDTWCPPKPRSGCRVWSLYQVNVSDDVEP